MGILNRLRSCLSARFNTAESLTDYEEDPTRYTPGGYHPVAIGDVYHKRYQIKSKLGYGLYSTVWLAQDLRTSRHVAVKILAAEFWGGEESVYELEILEHISKTNPKHPGYPHVIHLLDHFTLTGPHGTHLCLIFKVMGESVRELRFRFPTRQIPLHLMVQITRQLLQALDYLHTSCGVIHTDIKSANILVEIEDDDLETLTQDHGRCKSQKINPKTSTAYIQCQPLPLPSVESVKMIKVRLADFGVACWTDDHMTKWIQPIALRAPEVTLGVPWDAKVDIWSVACTVFELLQGYNLFWAKNDENGRYTAQEHQLSQMIELLGSFPTELLYRGARASVFFDGTARLKNFRELCPRSMENKINARRNSDIADGDVKVFSAFLKSMLRYMPEERCDAATALNDPWLLTTSKREN